MKTGKFRKKKKKDQKIKPSTNSCVENSTDLESPRLTSPASGSQGRGMKWDTIP